MGNPVQSRPDPAASHSTPNLTAPVRQCPQRPLQLAPVRSASASCRVLSRHLAHHTHCRPPSASPKAPADRRQPPIYPNSSPDHPRLLLPLPLPVSSPRPSLSIGGFGLNRRPKKLDGYDEARLIALACSQPPEGRASWTLQLLADRLVECEIVDSISTETVRQTLKKRTQALAERVLVHPATGQRRVRLRHGGRAGGLPPSIRGQRGAGVPGRNQQTVGEGDPPAPPAAAQGCHGVRL